MKIERERERERERWFRVAKTLPSKTRECRTTLKLQEGWPKHPQNPKWVVGLSRKATRGGQITRNRPPNDLLRWSDNPLWSLKQALPPFTWLLVVVEPPHSPKKGGQTVPALKGVVGQKIVI